VVLAKMLSFLYLISELFCDRYRKAPILLEATDINYCR